MKYEKCFLHSRKVIQFQRIDFHTLNKAVANLTVKWNNHSRKIKDWILVLMGTIPFNKIPKGNSYHIHTIDDILTKEMLETDSRTLITSNKLHPKSTKRITKET